MFKRFFRNAIKACLDLNKFHSETSDFIKVTNLKTSKIESRWSGLRRDQFDSWKQELAWHNVGLVI